MIKPEDRDIESTSINTIGELEIYLNTRGDGQVDYIYLTYKELDELHTEATAQMILGE